MSGTRVVKREESMGDHGEIHGERDRQFLLEHNILVDGHSFSREVVHMLHDSHYIL
jgi:hypothetical protein